MATQKIILYAILGTFLNSIIAVFIIEMAEAGHSIFGYYFGYILPFISLFSYLSYLKFRKYEIEALKIKHFFRPTQFLSSVIVFGFLIASIIFNLSYQENFSLNYLGELGLFILGMLVIVIIPNLILESIFYHFYLKRKNK